MNASRALSRGRLSVMLAALTIVLLPRPASAAHLSELPSALVITKSSNRNQVNYAVKVDETCTPSMPEPVRPYWRMLERGPFATEPLSESELRVLGVARQDVAGHRVQVGLRGMPNRTIAIETERSPDGQCTSSATMTIAGVSARLAGVYIQQRLFGIQYVLLTGWSEDGTFVQERVSP